MNKRKKILLVSLSEEFGGAETYYVKLGRMLSSAADVSALVLNAKLAACFDQVGLRQVQHLEPSKGMAGIYRSGFRGLLATLGLERPELIHFNGAHETYLAPVARYHRIPFCITRHNQLDTPLLRPRLKKPFILSQLQAAQSVICVSQQIHDELKPNVNKLSLRQIPTWVSDVGSPREPDPSLSGPLKLLYVGRLIPEKGIGDLVEAMRHVQGATLIVVGEGPELETARKASEGLPIHFEGFSRETERYYREADLLIFPSREGYEGLPQVPLEAMASGLPCLCSDIVATRELIGSDEVPAFRPGDPQDLAAHINELVRNPKRLSQLSRLGIERIRDKYTEAVVKQAYLDAMGL